MMPPRPRRYLREAAAMLVLARVAVRLVPAARLFAWAGKPPRRIKRFAASEIAWIAWAVETLSGRSWMRGHELARALAAQAMLRRRGIASQLCVGVARDGARLAAQAWVERRGKRRRNARCRPRHASGGVRLGAGMRLRRACFWGGIYGLTGARIESRRQFVIEMAGLQGRETTLARDLSGGWRQRLALGCAILHEPPILFLDEPTGGVDPLARRQFWRLIDDLSQAGVTVLVTTHYLDEAERCHRVALIHAGALAAIGTTREVKQTFAGRSIAEVRGPPIRFRR